MRLKATRIAPLMMAVATSIGLGSEAMAAGCPAAPTPIYSLDYGSRYSESSSNRAVIDAGANQEVDEALAPVDDFLRSLADQADKVHEAGADQRGIADCVLSQIAVWAQANALTDLKSSTANLTIGSRIASIGMVVLQVMPFRSSDLQLAAIRPWMQELMTRQMVFWEASAPDGAKQGNLRAWAALAGSATSTILEDPVIRGWSAWSTTYVLCTASSDGSLPQEMSRGKYALHYQLHAIAPLTVSTALLSAKGIDLSDRCNGALKRVVDFAVEDLNDGRNSTRITGKTQSFFDGSDQLKGFNLAWLEAYLTIHYDPKLISLAERYRPLSYSKLGGNQTLMWANF